MARTLTGAGGVLGMLVCCGCNSAAYNLNGAVPPPELTPDTTAEQRTTPYASDALCEHRQPRRPGMAGGPSGTLTTPMTGPPWVRNDATAS